MKLLSIRKKREEFPTKAQRNEVYRLVLATIFQGGYICDKIIIAHYILFGKTIHYIEVVDLYPELLKQKPAGVSATRPWWPIEDIGSRKKALIQCIEETKQ